MTTLASRAFTKALLQLSCILCIGTILIPQAAAQERKKFPTININYGRDAKNTIKLISDNSDIIKQCDQLACSMIITLTTVQAESQQGEVSESARDMHQEILEMFREIVSECKKLKYRCENEISSEESRISSCDNYIKNFKSRKSPKGDL